MSYRPVLGLDACHGQQACYIPYKEFALSECSFQLSTHMSIEYGCVPAPASDRLTDMCSGEEVAGRKGFLASRGYPQVADGLACQARVRVAAGKIVKAWIIDMRLSGDDLRDEG